MLERRDLLRLIPLAAAAAALGACDARPTAGPAGPAVSASPAGPSLPAPLAIGEGTGLTLAASHLRRSAGDPAAVPTVVAQMNRLGGALLAALGAQQPGNRAVSPYSVAVALGLTQDGARGTTREQLLAWLGPDAATVDGGLNALTAHVESAAGPGVTLASANAIFAQAGESWRPAFLDALATSYGAGVHEVDFAGDADAAVAAVNRWASNQTHGTIPDLLPRQDVTVLTAMVLVNALHLDASWARRLQQQPRTTAFHRLDGTTTRVRMLASPPGLVQSFAAGDGWRACTVPYRGRALAMTLVLPDDGRLDDAERQLASGAVLGAMRDQEVLLQLPAFTLDATADLVGPLRSIGIIDVFDEATADLSGMTAHDQLSVTHVAHRVHVAVGARGTEASAATAVVASRVSGVVPLDAELEELLVLDRPFLFLVHDVRYGTPLFLGRVVDPEGDR